MDKVMPVYIVFQLFEAICVSTLRGLASTKGEGYLHSERPEYLLIVALFLFKTMAPLPPAIPTSQTVNADKPN